MSRRLNIQLHINITPELSNRLDEAQRLEGRTVTYIVTKAVEQYLSIYKSIKEEAKNA
jgi:predicted DNA-binding protein